MRSASLAALRRFLSSLPDLVLIHAFGFLLSLAAHRIFRILEEEEEEEEEAEQEELPRSFPGLRLLHTRSGPSAGLACLVCEPEPRPGRERDAGRWVRHRCDAASAAAFRPLPLYLQLHLLNYPRDGESSWENMEEPGALVPIGRRQTGLQARLDALVTSIRRAADRISGRDPF